jgi:hypothetical protein
MARTGKGPLSVTPNPAKKGGAVVPSNAMQGEKTIPASARLKGLSGGPARLTKAGRGSNTYGPAASKKR